MFAVPEFPILVVERVTEKASGRPLFLAAARDWREDGVPTLWLGVEH